jgi:30S ribosomal protein S31
MGKGDKKSKKGKRWSGSFGNNRNKNAIKARIKRAATIAKPTEEKTTTAKPKAKRTVKKKEAAAE